MTTNEDVLTERRGAVLVLTLNRPDRLNAWTDVLEDRYFDLLDEADADPTVRAVVVTGAGRGFCAGADMDDLKLAGDVEASNIVPRDRPKHYPLSFRKPLVAAINGAAAGLGLIEAAYCDVRFATPSAKFTSSFAQRALIAEYGIAWVLPRIVGVSRALDILMSARVFTGTEAHRMGFVDVLADADTLLEQAVAYADHLSRTCSPRSMSTIKSQVQQAMSTDLTTAVGQADREMYASFAHSDVQEGVTSYLERRPPAFAPLPPQ